MKRSFAVTWVSQTLVIFSVVLVVFTAGIVVYNETGSLISFSIIMLCGYVPELLVIPFSGSAIDKLPRKSVLIGCSSMQAIIFTFYFLQLMQDASNLKITCLVIGASSAVAGIHRLAYNSSIALFTENPLVYPRLNGLVQSGLASAHIMAPLVAGLLLEYAESWIIAGTAVLACVISAFSLLAIRFPELTTRTSTSSKDGLKLGLNHIRQSRGLPQFLVIHAFANFARGAAIVLFTPFILSFSSEVILGSLRSTAGIGMAIGSLLIASWGGPHRQLSGTLYALAFSGLMIALIGISQNLAIIGIAAFLLFLATPILGSLAHAIWQHQVPTNIQARVFAVRDTVAGAALALGYVISPWITNFIFVPHSDTPATGIGFTYVVMGIITIALAMSALKQPMLKALES